MQLRGTVAKVEWINPHTWIHIDVKDANGAAVRWMIEGGTPNTLLRRGLTKASLPEGTEIVVDGYRAKNGRNRANGRDVTFADGASCSWDRRAPARHAMDVTHRRNERSAELAESRTFLARPRARLN